MLGAGEWGGTCSLVGGRWWFKRSAWRWVQLGGGVGGSAPSHVGLGGRGGADALQEALEPWHFRAGRQGPEGGSRRRGLGCALPPGCVPLGDSGQHPGRGSGSHLNSAASPRFLAPPASRAPPDPWSPLGLVSVTPTGDGPWAWCGKRCSPAVSSPDLWPMLPCACGSGHSLWPWLQWLWPPPGFLSVDAGGGSRRRGVPASGSSVEEAAVALCFAQLRK